MGASFWSYPYGFTMVFNARLVLSIPHTDRPVWSHDRWIFILALALGEVVLLPETLASYRRHGANASQLRPPPPLAPATILGGWREGYDEETKVVARIASYLALHARDATVPGSGALAAAAQAYARLARHLADRSRFATTDLGRLDRARQWLRLCASGAYASHRKGGLGWRAALKDASCVLIPSIT